MKVPIRLYNHVGGEHTLLSPFLASCRTDQNRYPVVTGARPFYDLTNPVIYQRDEAIVKDEVDTKEKGVVSVVRRAGELSSSGEGDLFGN